MGGFVFGSIGDGGECRKFTKRLTGPVGIGDIEFVGYCFIVYITRQACRLGDTDIRDDRKHSLKRRSGRKAVAFGELYLPAAGLVGLSRENVLGAQHLMWQQAVKRLRTVALHRLCRDGVAGRDSRLRLIVVPYHSGVRDMVVSDGCEACDSFRLAIW